MIVSDLVQKLNLQVHAGHEGLNNIISKGFISDLLNEVLLNAKSGNIWITVQTHKNVITVACLKEISAVLMVNGLLPNKDTIIASNENKLPILGTTLNSFEITGKLYNILLNESL